MWQRWFGRQKKALEEPTQPMAQPLSEAEIFDKSENTNLSMAENANPLSNKLSLEIEPGEDSGLENLVTAEEWFNRGNNLFTVGDFKGAIDSYYKALSKYQKNQINSPEIPASDNFSRVSRALEEDKDYDKTLDDQPDEHGIWYNLSLALHNLRLYEQEIFSYRKALEIKPNNYKAWSNLGVALRISAVHVDYSFEDLPGYIHYEGTNIVQHTIANCTTHYDSKKLKEAVVSYEQALQIKPDYHNAWYKLGNTLMELGQTSKAIFSYQQALEIQPDDYNVWEKLGDAFYSLNRWEEALHTYNQRLHYNPNGSDTWLNHGKTLAKLGRYREAIASFDKAHDPFNFHSVCKFKAHALLELEEWEEAISILRQTLDTVDYETRNALGSAQHMLANYEDAIHSYGDALVINPKYWQAWVNRGWAAAASKKCEVPVALSLPVALQNPSLDYRGDYRAEVINCIEGLKYVQPTEDPKGWGQLHRHTGLAYYGQGHDNPLASYYYRQALRSYETASPALEPFRESYLELIHDMLQVHIGLRNTAEAKGLQQKASELLDRLLKETPSPNQRKQLRLKFSGFRQLTVTFLAQEGKFIEALQSAEIEKQAFLTWLLSNEDFPPNNQDFSSEKSLYYQFRQLLANRPTTAILSWHLSPAALTTFLLLPQSSDPILIPAPDPVQVTDQPASLKQVIDLENWIKTWNLDYADYVKSSSKQARESYSWRIKMLKRLEDLKHHLNLSAILEHLPGITQLILIPHRDLHRFPLHALFPKTFTITYLPSLQVGINLQQRSFTPIQNLLITEAPNSTGNSTNPKKFERLEHASLESLLIRQLFSNTTISSTEATRSTLHKHLQSSYDGFHFTGHSAYNTSAPSQSALYLTGEDCLTVTDICGAPPLASGYKLVCLSACETALTGNQTLTAEYVGLVSGFLRSGASQVVSTLWTVQSLSSSLLMVHFYSSLKAGINAPTALKQAQDWLREAYRDDLIKFLEDWYERQPPENRSDRSFLNTEIRRLRKMYSDKDKPFAHPYHWAAFTITTLPSQP